MALSHQVVWKGSEGLGFGWWMQSLGFGLCSYRRDDLLVREVYCRYGSHHRNPQPASSLTVLLRLRWVPTDSNEEFAELRKNDGI